MCNLQVSFGDGAPWNDGYGVFSTCVIYTLGSRCE